ncbi:BQ2448_4640 [Microbotryum intermedium]|uniref:BQ2448_4640 protein n=1 Tax=Microbotryum intermedium TaxID=269621 RepID=A0A238FLJ0_9BASI|nr:BQ2448_4640 [Microbotryum intermedium]
MAPQAKMPFSDLQKIIPNSRKSPFGSLRKPSRFIRRSSHRGETAFTDMGEFDPVIDDLSSTNIETL